MPGFVKSHLAAATADNCLRTYSARNRQKIHLMSAALLTAVLFHCCLRPGATALEISSSPRNPPDAVPSSSAVLPEKIPRRAFKLAVILPYENKYLWSKVRVEPGIRYAIDTLKKRLPQLNMIVNYGDSQCSEIYGPLKAIDMFYNKSADVFIGPACDYAVAPIARFSPHWNIPVITGGALVQAFSDKVKQYKLLTRISGSHAKLSESLALMFTQFNWSIAGLLYTNNLGPRQVYGKTDCFFVMESIFNTFKAKFRNATRDRDMWNKAFDEHDPGGYNATSLLMDASTAARSE